MGLYRIQGVHLADGLRLKEIKDRLQVPPISFSNYEMVIQYGEDSYAFIYNYGSAVFFNVPDAVREKELASFQEVRGASEVGRLTDVFTVETRELNPGEAPSNRVFFDRVLCHSLSFPKIRIICMLLAESTGLDYYEELIERMLAQTNSYSKKLERQGKLLQGSQEFIKFIGRVLSTKQEIISNLYIVDSPDETWEDSELDKLHQEFKLMMEIDTRYRALEYKIKIIQESLEIFVDLSKTRKETLLEVTIILLIAFEVVFSLVKSFRGE